MNTLTGKTIQQGIENIPSKQDLIKNFDALEYRKFDQTKKEREMIIYRSFNLEKINI